MQRARCTVVSHHTWSASSSALVPCKDTPQAVRVRCRLSTVRAVSVYDGHGTRKRFAPCVNGKPGRRRRGLNGARRRRR